MYTEFHKCPYWHDRWNQPPGYTFHRDLKSHIKWCHTFTCKGCQKPFLEDKFYRHVSHAPKCKREYGEDEWNEMLKKKRNKVIKKYENKRKPQRPKYRKEHYQENKSKIMEKVLKTRKEAKLEKTIEFMKRWLKGPEESMKKKMAEEAKKSLRPLLGGIYYYTKINSEIEVPNPDISEILSNLDLDVEVGNQLEDELAKEFSEVWTKANGLVQVDAEKLLAFQLKSRYDKMYEPFIKMKKGFSDFMEDEWKSFQNTVQNRFVDLANILEKKTQHYQSEFLQYHALAIGKDDQLAAKNFETPDFLNYCEKAFLKAL